MNKKRSDKKGLLNKLSGQDSQQARLLTNKGKKKSVSPLKTKLKKKGSKSILKDGKTSDRVKGAIKKVVTISKMAKKNKKLKKQLNRIKKIKKKKGISISWLEQQA